MLIKVKGNHPVLCLIMLFALFSAIKRLIERFWILNIYIFLILPFLKLGKKANMTKQVQPIGLPDPESIFQPKSCLVSGWGVTSENNEHQSHVLMEVNVTLTDSQPCPKEHFYCSKGESGPHKVRTFIWPGNGMNQIKHTVSERSLHPVSLLSGGFWRPAGLWRWKSTWDRVCFLPSTIKRLKTQCFHQDTQLRELDPFNHEGALE